MTPFDGNSAPIWIDRGITHTLGYYASISIHGFAHIKYTGILIAFVDGKTERIHVFF